MVNVGKRAKSLMARKKSLSPLSKTNDVTEVTRCFFLNDIFTWDSSLRRDREFRWGDHSPESMVTQTFRVVEPQVTEVEVQGEEETQVMLRALVRLGIRCLHKEDEEGAEPIFTLEATFCADYFILSTPSEETFKKFVDFNCIHNVWPFWRQHVFDTLKRASLPVPSVPLYASQSKYRRKKVRVTKVLTEAGNSE